MYMWKVCSTIGYPRSGFICPPPVQSHPDVEYSEMVLYEVQLMREAGRGEEALKHLALYEPHISDLLTFEETRGGIESRDAPLNATSSKTFQDPNKNIIASLAGI